MNKIVFNKNFYENLSWSRSKVVYGLDEAGRGSLAGPVVAACVVLPINESCLLLKDSKLLKKEDLLVAMEWIKSNCFYTYSVISHRLIDRHNIYQATIMAMRKSIIQMLTFFKEMPTYVLIDAVHIEMKILEKLKIKSISLIKGELKSSSIAAASIVAKTKRDLIMQKLHVSFPNYDFERHYGYGTPGHKKELKIKNSSIIHRKSFLSFLAEEKNKKIF